MSLLLVLLYPALVLISCRTSVAHAPDRPEECLRFRKISYQIVNNESSIQLSSSDNVWYQDSVGITELSIIQSVQTDSRDTIYPVTVGYRFVDMRKKWVYEYRTLSDTATIVQKFGKADSAKPPGGWSFYRTAAIKFDSLLVIGDTSINDITFRKHRYVQHFQGRRFLTEILSRCDRKGTFFLLDVGVSNAIGCPMVKGTSLTPDGRLPTQSAEIEFISNTFPDSVRRVFAAWKRNVELYPVE
jgi:hypothetical protein